MALPINIEELIHGQSIESDRLESLERNGSPMPILETDSECNYFLTVIYVHPEAKSVEAIEQASNQDKPQNISLLEDINTLLTKQVTKQVTKQPTR